MEAIMNAMSKTLFAGLALAVTGCATQSSTRKASVVDFLFPNKGEPIEVAGPTTMALPLRVGIVFVPETAVKLPEYAEYRWATPSISPFTEKDKLALMEQIGRSFRQYPFVRSVEIIPSQYLAPGGSFDNLDQIRTMFGTDVIVLLSYDQVQSTGEGAATFTYWTIVGAYVVQGERNTTKTMLDAVVYYLPSRKLLFRAPGFSEVRAGSTPVGLSEELRLDSIKGFQLAATNLVTSLQEQLVVFKDRIKEEPEEFKVTAKPGYDLKAVGAIDRGTMLVLLAFTGGLYLCRRIQDSR
jgi:rhombotail lipoprotein